MTGLVVGLLCGLAGAVVGGALVYWWPIVHRKLSRALRLAKAAATDPRLPRPVRWLFVTGLAVKCLPVDFGLDEVLLGTGLVLLFTRYRKTWAAIRSEIQ
jgi:hypothetical protein